MKKLFIFTIIIILLLQLCGCTIAASKQIEVSPADTVEETVLPSLSSSPSQSPLPSTNAPTATPILPTSSPKPKLPTSSPKPTALPTPSPTPIPGDIVSMGDAVYGYEEMTADINKLLEKFPQYLTKQTIGKSTYGREIPLIILGNTNASKKILIQGSTHAREYVTSLLIMKQIEDYCELYTSGTYNNMSYANLFNQCAIYFVPMINPDGVDISIYGLDSVPAEWQQLISDINGNNAYKNWKANGAGVDLNGNFGTGLGDLSKLPTSPQPDGYPGPYPFSEPETQIIKQLCINNAFLNVTSYHACGKIIYWYYFQDDTTKTRDYQYALELQKLTGYSLVAPEKIDATTVGLKDWFVQQYNRPGFTIEVGASSYGTPVPAKEVINIWNQNYLVPIHLAWKECS